MNLFRSEEHARRWAKFDPASEGSLKPVADIATLFSRPMFRERLAPDFLLRLRDLARDFEAYINQLDPSWSYWQTPPRQ